jgi:hypothetical protein
MVAMHPLGQNPFLSPMNFPSNSLGPILTQLECHNEVLGKARAEYLALEAERKHHEAMLIQSSPGKSHAEKVTNAQANPEWPEFQLRLARAEAVYEFQKLKFTIMEKEWQSEYLCMKLDGSVIKKQD